MKDPRVEKLAGLLVNYCIAVEPGERILVGGPSVALPLITETFREVIRVGGMPLTVINEEVFSEILLKEGNAEQIQHVPEPMAYIYENYEGMIHVDAANNTRSLSGVDPKKQQMRHLATRELSQTMMDRTASGELRWVYTMFPSNANAQEADMSLGEYEAFVYGACHVDKEDPVAEWRKMSEMQQKLVDWLADKDQVRVCGPEVDLTLSIAGRTFINADGRQNMPSGEIFTGPVEDSANGWVRFTYPAISDGREVEGIFLRFKNGEVVEATARKNEQYLHDQLETDEGARRLGEFAIGTNRGIQRFTKSILFDEKLGGTMHMALGAGYPESGSKNRSAIHWDMICDMRDGGEIWVDGELFYDSGRFTILEQ